MEGKIEIYSVYVKHSNSWKNQGRIFFIYISLILKSEQHIAVQ